MNEQGELIVIGKDSVQIRLKRRPRHVVCRFKDERKIVPCDPNHSDSLEYYTFLKHNQVFLEIKWDVSGSREILWEVRY